MATPAINHKSMHDQTLEALLAEDIMFVGVRQLVF
jgi:hypothetical protein